MAFILTQIGYLSILKTDLSIADIPTKDHDLLDGLGDDDHSKYPLVTNFEADRATIATYWQDLTDGGETALHSHAGGGSVWTASASDIYWDGGGQVIIGEATANAKMTEGLTIFQGASDNEIFACKSSDVTHGFTTDAEEDTFGNLQKIGPTTGGLKIIGMGEGTAGVQIFGKATNADTSKGSGGEAPIELRAGKLNGSTVGPLGANENLVVITNSGSTKWVVDADGDTVQTGSLTLGARTLSETDLTDLLDGGETSLHSHAGGGVDTSGTPEALDFARFTDVDTIEGRSPAQTLADISAMGLAGGTFTGAVEPYDHGAATSPEIVAVVYGTTTPPTASTTPIGTLWVKYTA